MRCFWRSLRRFLAIVITFGVLMGALAAAAAAAKYRTVSPCEAARAALRAEAPAALADLARRDARFAALQAGGVLLGRLDLAFTAAASDAAAGAVADRGSGACVVVLLRRELAPTAFRRELGDAIGGAVAERMGFDAPRG